jgi:hypothetical protein
VPGSTLVADLRLPPSTLMRAALAPSPRAAAGGQG